MIYSALTALIEPATLSHSALAHQFAHTCEMAGGHVPQSCIAQLEKLFDGVACLEEVEKIVAERDELRRKVAELEARDGKRTIVMDDCQVENFRVGQKPDTPGQA